MRSTQEATARKAALHQEAPTGEVFQAVPDDVVEGTPLDYDDLTVGLKVTEYRACGRTVWAADGLIQYRASFGVTVKRGWTRRVAGAEYKNDGPNRDDVRPAQLADRRVVLVAR